MAENNRSDARTETSVVDIRTRDLSEFEEGEPVRIHYRDADDEPHKCLTGRVEMHYSDRKAMLETDDGRRVIVDLSDVTEDNIRDFDTEESIGRGMFAEPAWHVEQDGEALRDELLGDDEDDEETEECHEGTCDREATETLVCEVKGELGFCAGHYEVVADDEGEAVEECPDCGAAGEYAGDVPTNTGPTAVEPGYVEAWECEECGSKWTA